MSDFNRLVRMRKAWVDLWPHADEDLVLDAFGRLVGRYTDPARAYHNLAHIDSILTEFEASPEAAIDAHAVCIAIWYHKAKYDSHATDNEHRSVGFARRELTALGVDAQLLHYVSALIFAMSHKTQPKIPDEMLVADLDLSIFGRPWPEYLAYSKALRDEFPWIDTTEFRKRRIEDLTQLTERGIFWTCYYKSKYEVQALRNIEREIAMYRAH